MQPDIVPIICHRCQWHRWQICRRCRWYRWQFATGVVDTGGKFAAGVNNTRETGGKICRRCRWYRWQICRRCRSYRRQFATGVIDTGGAPWLANISASFRKNSKWSLCYYQGLGGRWSMKKTWSKKSRDTVPLRQFTDNEDWIQLEQESPLMNKKGFKGGPGVWPGHRRFIWRGIYVEWTGGTEAYSYHAVSGIHGHEAQI